MSTKKLWWLLPLACLTACANSGNHEKYLSRKDSAGTSASADTSDGVLPLTSPERKIIRTADFTCKVENVLNAVNSLERIVTSAGGVVQDSRIANSTGEVQTLEYKPDSLKRAQTYTTTATLTLRIPSDRIDSVVQNIPAMVTFIDARTLLQSDVTAQYMGNHLKTTVGTKVYTPQKGVQLAKKTEDLVQLQEYEDTKQEQLINRKMENMLLMDNVHYATITVALSQPPQVFVQTIVNPDYFTKVPYGIQFKSSLTEGWNAILTVFIGLTTLWPFILLGILGWSGYRFYIKKYRKESNKIRQQSAGLAT